MHRCLRERRRPYIFTYNASTVPVLQLALAGQGLNEQELYDTGVNFIRPRLVTIHGAVLPNAYGGKQRQIQVDLNTTELQAKGLSPMDVVNADQRPEPYSPRRDGQDRPI